MGRGVIRFVCLVATAFAALACPSAVFALEVTTTADSNGVCDADCSIREAIAKTPAGGTVSIPASATPYEVTDALGPLVIEKDLTVDGAGARKTEVSAVGTSARVFTVFSEALARSDVTIRDLSITDGDGGGGGTFGEGGGVLAEKKASLVGPALLLEAVRIADNTATVGAGSQSVGGGVAGDGASTVVTIRNSLVEGNRSIGTAGGQATAGGFDTFASSSGVIENSTFVGNEALGTHLSNAPTPGGALVAGAESAIRNSTFYGNIAKRTAPGAAEGVAGNLIVGGTTTVANTIVSGGIADKAGTEDCVAPLTVNSLGGNVLPAACGPSPQDKSAANALLGALADNGGETDTLALLAGSPALDSALGCPPPATDQRGVARPQGTGCDSGAFELEVTFLPIGPRVIVDGKPITCQGKRATIVGNGKRNVLRGTRKRDVIVAVAGNDKVLAKGGNDLVCAGTGNDTVKGGPGKDRLLGQKGRDTLIGGPGRDKLVGGKGRDAVTQ